MSALWERVLNNPALAFALLGAAVNLGAAYGLVVTPVQLAGIDAVIAAFVGALTRANVTPLRNLPPAVTLGGGVGAPCTVPEGMVLVPARRIGTTEQFVIPTSIDPTVIVPPSGLLGGPATPTDPPSAPAVP